ncbi:hypothetical protein [Leucobacter sp. GX24907]
MTQLDTIGALAGLDAASSARIRGHRPDAVEAAEESLHALFDVPEGDEASGLSRQHRLLAAARAAHADGAPAVADLYLEMLEEEVDGVDTATGLDIERLRALALEGADGPVASAADRSIRALLRHTDLLVQRPAAATSDDLDALAAAGWSVTETVVLSQVIAFTSYQTRVVAGLAVLQEASA